MKRWTVSLLILGLSGLVVGPVTASEHEPGVIRAGVAVEDITWHPGAGQTGFGERWRPYHAQEQGVEANMYGRLMKPSEGVHMRLRTKVMVIDDGVKKIAIVSSDLLGTGFFRSSPRSNDAYRSESVPFEVTASDELVIEDVQRTDAVVSFVVAYPQAPEQWRYRPAHASTGSATIFEDGVMVGTATFDSDLGRFVADGLTLGSGALAITFEDTYGNTGQL